MIDSHRFAWSFVIKNVGILNCDEMFRIKVKYKFIQMEKLAFVNDDSIKGVPTPTFMAKMFSSWFRQV